MSERRALRQQEANSLEAHTVRRRTRHAHSPARWHLMMHGDDDDGSLALASLARSLSLCRWASAERARGASPFFFSSFHTASLPLLITFSPFAFSPLRSDLGHAAHVRDVARFARAEAAGGRAGLRAALHAGHALQTYAAAVAAARTEPPYRPADRLACHAAAICHRAHAPSPHRMPEHKQAPRPRRRAARLRRRRCSIRI